MVLRLAAFFVVWALYFSISESASSIHNDMAEAYAWGREFQLGYNQHPPFWAWICGAWFLVFPRTNWAFALLSSLNATIGLWGAYRLVRRFAGRDQSVAAAALLALTPFYTFLSFKYNANSIFLSLWPWTLYFFVGALRGRSPESFGWNIRDSIGFGAMMGLSLDSKYFALTLAASCLTAALAAPERARYFWSVSPYLSVVVALGLWAPHLLWLMNAGAPPIRYLARVSGRGMAETLGFAATALVGAALQQILLFGAVALFARRRPAVLERLSAAPQSGELASPRLPSEDRRLIYVLAFAPVIFAVVAALALRTKISSNMLIGVFALSPLVAMDLWPNFNAMRLRRLAARTAAVVSLGALLASPIVAIVKSGYARDPEDSEPRREVARAATEFWRATTSAPLAFVAGSFRYDNAAAFYSEEHPSVFVGFDYFGNRWATPEKIAARGLLTICLKSDAECLARTAEFATPETKQEDVTLAKPAFGQTRKPLEFVLTAVPPRRIGS